MVLSYNKTILNTTKFHNQLAEAFETYDKFLINGNSVSITFLQDLDQTTIDACDIFINEFVNYTTVDQLETYLSTEVQPFIKNLINMFAVENISMGITQAGKTDYVLGLFCKKYEIPSGNTLLPISLKDAFDTGSLYSARSVIQYIRDNASEYSGLSPYVTDARLLKMKNDIETFLNIELST